MIMARQVMIIGIGGPSCGGKTSLAKHLKSILDPHAHILHQDDFAPPAEKLPIHPVHNVQDWDDPEGAVEWNLMQEAMQHIRSTGELPPELKSHDSLNILDPVPVKQETLDHWKRQFAELQGSFAFNLVDGFIMYWDPKVFNQLDVKFIIREEYQVLKKRREGRNGYFTATGDHWQDPPGYWDDIVWPAYIKAHRSCFVNGDVERGPVDPSTEAGHDLRLLDAERKPMDTLLNQACQDIWHHIVQQQQEARETRN